MTEPTPPGVPAAETFSERLIRREAKRLAALDLSTSSPIGLENALARISEEVTAEAAEAKAKDAGGSTAK